jgi:hypothetical protein
MVAKYYVAIRPQTNEYHAVHKEDCPFLPENEKRIYLGMFSSGKEAVREGQIHFTRASCCPFCLKEVQTEKGQPVFYKKDIVPSDSQILQSLKGNLLYLLN